MRYAMVIDLDKCVGCHTCEIACKAENLTPVGDFRCRLVKVETKRSAYETWLRLSCVHCEKPSCREVCPAGAISKQHNGLVMIDKEACYGCGKCVQACPYNAVTRASGKRYFDLPTAYEEAAAEHQTHPRFKADKCTFCAHLLAQGRAPKCVSACISEALFFGDLDDPESTVSKLWHEATPLLHASGNGPAVAVIQKDARHAELAEVEQAVKNAGPPNISAGLV